MALQPFTSERIYDGHLRVNSCGKQWLADRDYLTLRLQGRIDFSINYIAKGCGYFQTEGNSTPVPAGSLILYFPGEKQHYRFQKEDGTVMLWAHFSGTACSLLDTFKSGNGCVLKIPDQQQFETVFEKMITAYYKKNTVSETVCEGYMTVLLALIAQSREQPRQIGGRHENLEKVLSHMHLAYNAPIDINAYATLCCVSKDHFIRLFKAYTGETPYRYQLKIRIDCAIAMLENTPFSVRECAEAVGFESNAYFCRVFKRFTGHPPSYYKP